MSRIIITSDDLRKFKKELLDDFKKLLTHQATGKTRRYLKSADVMDLLNISSGTLQNLRSNGTLPFTKIGGTIFYDANDIQNLMEKNRVQCRLKSKSKL